MPIAAELHLLYEERQCYCERKGQRKGASKRQSNQSTNNNQHRHRLTNRVLQSAFGIRASGLSLSLVKLTNYFPWFANQPCHGNIRDSIHTVCLGTSVKNFERLV